MMNLPNTITTIRLVLVFVMITVLLIPYQQVDSITFLGVTNNLVFVIAGIIFLLASITDFLDGYLARKLNLVTTLGKFLDPIADKILTNASMLLLMVTFTWLDYPHLTFPVWIVLIMVIRDLMIDALRMIAVTKGVVIAALPSGKWKTFLQIIAITLVFFNDPITPLIGLPWSLALMMMVLAAIASLFSLVMYFIKYGRTILQ
jgi:CDP-diacylglycerol--glycerol-3-phosphate 3-phosphatidyltransferase